MKKLVLVMVVGAALAAGVQGEIIFSDGFENHSLGVMGATAASDIGDGWYDRWGTNSEVVVNTVALSGEQSLQVTRNHPKVTSGFQFPARSYFSSQGYPQANQLVKITWNLNRLNEASDPEIYVRTGGANLFAWGIGTDYVTQNYFATDAGGAFFDTGVAAGVGSWEKVVVEMSLVDVFGMVGGTYDMYVTQNNITTTLLIGGDLQPQVSDDWLDIYVNARPDVAGMPDNVIYYDDLTIELIPEPATMVMLGLGIVGLLRRRK